MGKRLVIILVLVACNGPFVRALNATGAGTTTTLSISSRSVDIGSPVTMTAKVLLGATTKSSPILSLCLLVFSAFAAGAEMNKGCDLPPQLHHEIAAKYPCRKLVDLSDLDEDDRCFFKKITVMRALV